MSEVNELADKYEQLAKRLYSTKKFAFLDLRDNQNNYCILGLMCELSGLGTWHNKLYYLKNSNISTCSLLPVKVAEYYELPTVNPYFVISELPDIDLQLEVKGVMRQSVPFVYLAHLSDRIALNNIDVGGPLLARIIRSGVQFK